MFAAGTLCAVNKNVSFTPSATIFELAECETSAKDWLHRKPGRSAKSIIKKSKIPVRMY